MKMNINWLSATILAVLCTSLATADNNSTEQNVNATIAVPTTAATTPIPKVHISLEYNVNISRSNQIEEDFP